jgi:hypothetical protein
MGANEVPPVNSPGTATGAYTLNAGGDSLTYTITIGTPMDSTAIMAHFHAAAPGSNGNVAIWLCETTIGATLVPPVTTTAPGNDPAPTCASGEVAAQTLATNKIAITAAQLNSLRTFAYYANVHSIKFQGGEIRGQVRNIAP